MANKEQLRRDIARYINTKPPAEIIPTDPTVPTDEHIDEALRESGRPSYNIFPADVEEEIATLPEDMVHKKFGRGSNKLSPFDEEILRRVGDDN